MTDRMSVLPERAMYRDLIPGLEEPLSPAAVQNITHARAKAFLE